MVAPAIVSGNTSVVLASQERPLPAVTLTEVLATSDLPGGVVNLLTGRTAEVAPWLASHMDVNAIDLAGAGPELVADLERAAAENLKRVLRRDRAASRTGSPSPASPGCCSRWRRRPSGIPSVRDRPIRAPVRMRR